MQQGCPPDARSFRIIGICRDGERLIFAEGLDIVDVYAQYRALLAEPELPRLVVEVERAIVSDPLPA